MSKEQASMLFIQGQAHLAAHRRKVAYKIFTAALAMMESNIDNTNGNEIMTLAGCYESASYSAYQIYYAGRPKLQIEWLKMRTSLQSAALTFVAKPLRSWRKTAKSALKNDSVIFCASSVCRALAIRQGNSTLLLNIASLLSASARTRCV